MPAARDTALADRPASPRSSRTWSAARSSRRLVSSLASTRRSGRAPPAARLIVPISLSADGDGDSSSARPLDRRSCHFPPPILSSASDRPGEGEVRFIVARLAQLVVVLLVVSGVAFLLLNQLPGNPVITLLGPA